MNKRKTGSNKPKAASKKQFITSWGAAASIALGIFLLVVRWNTLTAPFERDEGEYAYSSWLLSQGSLPYQDAFLQKPPMIVYTYYLAQLLGGFSVLPVRLLGLLFVIGTTVCLSLLARREFGRGAGITMAWLVTPMLMLPDLTPFASNAEVFMLLPLAGLLLLYSHKKGNSNPWVWFAAGSLGALSMMYKPICLFLLLFLAAVWLWEQWIAEKRLRILSKCIAFGLAGGVLTTGLILSWFLIHDRGLSFWECVVRFNFYYAGLGASGLQPFTTQCYELGTSWWITLPLLAWFFIRRPQRWWFYAGLFLAAWLGIYQTLILHYCLLLVPFLGLIITAAILDLSEYLELKRSQYALGAITALFLCLPIWPVVGLSPASVTDYLYSAENGFVESQEIAARVAALTKPDDFIFVAGSEPQILYHSQRRSSSRFVIVYPLMLTTPISVQYQQECIADLKKHPPEVIVFARSKLSWLQLEGTPAFFHDTLVKMIEDEYVLVGGTIQGFRGPGPLFKSGPLTEQDKSQASFFLFKKRTAR